MLAQKSLATRVNSSTLKSIFVDPDFELPSEQSESALHGLSFAAKDLFAIKGRCIGAGNPDWATSRTKCTENAAVIEQLLQKGAALKGVTVLDEFAFSLIGENAHYGAPPNPAWPSAFCGGSSCGSASAVSYGLSDFALGTDTAGSIRIPANNCRLYGLRVGGGVIDMKGVAPLSPSFDAVGWFARSWNVLNRVTTELVGPQRFGAAIIKLDIDALADQPAETVERLVAAGRKIASQPELEFSEWRFERSFQTEIAELLTEVELFEAWRIYADWLLSGDWTIADDILTRFQKGSTISEDHYNHCKKMLAGICSEIESSLGHSVLIRPTASLPPLSLQAGDNEKAQYRRHTLKHTAMVSALNWAELSAPLSQNDQEMPFGLSLCTPPGGESFAVHLARSLFEIEEHRN